MRTRKVLPLGLALLFGCTGYVQRAASPYEVVWLDRPDRTLVATADREYELARPRVVADSVVGTTTDRFGQEPGRRVALALEDIAWVATEEIDRTRALQGVGVGLLALFFTPVLLAFVW